MCPGFLSQETCYLFEKRVATVCSLLDFLVLSEESVSSIEEAYNTLKRFLYNPFMKIFLNFSLPSSKEELPPLSF